MERNPFQGSILQLMAVSLYFCVNHKGELKVLERWHVGSKAEIVDRKGYISSFYAFKKVAVSGKDEEKIDLDKLYWDPDSIKFMPFKEARKVLQDSLDYAKQVLGLSSNREVAMLPSSNAERRNNPRWTLGEKATKTESMYMEKINILKDRKSNIWHKAHLSSLRDYDSYFELEKKTEREIASLEVLMREDVEKEVLDFVAKKWLKETEEERYQRRFLQGKEMIASFAHETLSFLKVFDSVAELGLENHAYLLNETVDGGTVTCSNKAKLEFHHKRADLEEILSLSCLTPA